MPPFGIPSERAKKAQAQQIGTQSEKDKKIAAQLDFGAQLVRRIESGNVNNQVILELENILSCNCHHPPPHKAIDFDKLGTQLWNAAIRLKDQSSPIFTTWPRLESQLRVLAFIQLDTAQRAYVKHGSKKSSQNVIRVVKTGIKAARMCINANELNLCIRLFEKVAEYVEHQQAPPTDFKRNNEENEAQDMLKELTADYYLLRGTAAWKQDKPDTVAFWLMRVILHPERADMLHLAEKKADLTYEVGKAALKKKQFDNAVRWLSQSYEVFDDIDSELLSSDCCDLRLVVMLDLARALVGVGDQVSLNKASNLVVLLDQEHGFKTEIYLIRLDVIFAQKPFRADEFHGALVRIIRTAILSEGTFKAIMYQIQKLNTFHPEKNSTANPNTIANSNPGPYSQLACQSLDLLLSRLLAESPIPQQLLEKIVVSRVWISSLSLQAQDHPSKLQILFDDVCGAKRTGLGLEATHASQSLIWKAVTALQQSQNEAEAVKWCNLANHEIFASAGELNKAKLGRKMMTVALARGDATSAREAYYQMPESGKSAASTKYLMYKIALQEGDENLASQSLDGVLKASTKGDEKYLYACALEAQQIGDRKQFIIAMNKVLEFYEHNPSNDVRLPILLRCIAGAITTELSSHDMPLDAGLTELCKVFEAAKRHGSTFRDSNDETKLAELRWFACHSYNTALKHCSDMHPELLLRFMMASVSLIDALRGEGEKDDGLWNRLLLCRFLATSTLIVLARSEDNIEQALQLYLDARRQIEAFHKLYQEATNNQMLQSEVLQDIEIKEFELIKFDLEALMRLEHWNDLDKTLSMCLSPCHADRLESAADLILHIHAHISKSPDSSRLQAKIPSVMEKIINACWRNNKDITRLARWIRCLFLMTLTSDPTISLRCVDQACAIAAKAQVGRIPEPYPAEELAWLATMTFNHAVDLWFADEDKAESQKWAEKALNLSGVGGVGVGEGGGLHAVLQDKWMRLKGLGGE